MEDIVRFNGVKANQLVQMCKCAVHKQRRGFHLLCNAGQNELKIVNKRREGKWGDLDLVR